MAEMNAVESAECDHGVGDVAGFYEIVKNFHLMKN